MRALILTAGAALAVSACGSDQAAENSTRIDEGLAAQNITANDTTSIDAATGEAANMAEDVNFTLNDANELGEDSNLPAEEDGAANDSAGNRSD